MGPPSFEFSKDALALHFLFKDAKRLIDIVVAYDYLQKIFLPMMSSDDKGAHRPAAKPRSPCQRGSLRNDLLRKKPKGVPLNSNPADIGR